MKRMMKSALAVPVLVTLLTASACSSDDTNSSDTAASSACKEILGEPAMTWLRKSAGAEIIHMASSYDQKQVRDLFHKQLRSWEPRNSADPYTPFTIAGADVCGADKEGAGLGRTFSVRYNVAFHPFAKISGGDGGTTIPTNSDVTLATRKRIRGTNAYEVYFKCAIPGAHPELEQRLPVVGTMTDDLTGDRDVRVHFQHLLHSAQVMARTLDCQNNPVIPTEPPASVK